MGPNPHQRNRLRPDLDWTRVLAHNLVRISALAA